jgi:hypothetical protein
VTCFLVAPTNQELLRTCTVTHQSNVIKSVVIQNLCSATCDSTSLYTVRLKNAVNKFTSDPYTGTLLIETKDSLGNHIGSVTRQMSTQANLTPGVLQAVSVTRSTNTQGLASQFTLMFTTPGYLIDDAIVEVFLPDN